ncbi:M61 family metallopeptidase [Flagellimonas flava]|uniref:Predicted metalloprotease, contains C-terminal PDZ domain n=1 Tax=Flagellimonas flava TaxID=570519 RepID=A0A1M5KGV9_9FLAO|nr:peptidase M61 [Allomuricauda flava]SHG51860.1 Predicted metalloprotease, contains C-terminal PDZ domain [Allomuricauda flava]
MFKKYLSLMILLGLAMSCKTKNISNDLASQNPIRTQLDLVNLQNDKVEVSIDPGRFVRDTVVYRLPRVVQGTYAVSDFGKYIEGLKGIDYEGNELAVTKQDTNTWMIPNAQNLDRLIYWVNDTFDQEIQGGIGEEIPFSPSGTNIEEKQVMLNLHGFIGYFDSLKNSAYQIGITAPDAFNYTSPLQEINTSKSDDGKTKTSVFYANRYFEVTDNPMMYGETEVEEFMVGNIKIVLSVFSPNGLHTAAEIKETVHKMMLAQKEYLGDLDSTPRYDILLYLSDTEKEGSPKGFGALEHHTSTVVVLPESMQPEALAESMIDVVAHEFFHIVTPLSVHSEDVHYFDYNKPTFSKHLWLYEGVTEYFAQHFQVYEGLIDEAEYFSRTTQKINGSRSNYDDSMSFTQMSENILESPYKENYANVYLKGALIGMCLDILMRENSDGQRSLRSLMAELSVKYGKNKPFTDDNLVNEIAEMTYPAVKEFLNTNVIGSTPINYDVFFERVGLHFDEAQVETNYLQNAGNLIVGADPERGGIKFNDLVENNSFWTEQGAQPNDLFKSINGNEVNLANANQVFGEVFSWKPGKEIEVVLLRGGDEIMIKTTTTPSYTKAKTLVENPDATTSQKALRDAWLKG